MTEELKKLLQECDTLKARLVALRPLPAEAQKKIDEAFTSVRDKIAISCM